jgi:lysozyme
MTKFGLEMLKRHEGCRLSPYRDTKGKLTIGYGHNLDDKPLSKDAVNFILECDIADVESELWGLPFYKDLSAEVKDVLVDLGVNLGIAGLLAFKKTLFFIGNRQWHNAADELMDSDAARELHVRYGELANILRSQK